MASLKKGLIVLIPYQSGQDYNSNEDFMFWNSYKYGSIEYSTEGKGNFDAEFDSEVLSENYLDSEEYEEDYEIRCDNCSLESEFPKVLLNPETGKLQWAILSLIGSGGKWIVTPNEDIYEELTYLPVFVNTSSTRVALKTVSGKKSSGNIPLVEEAFDIPDHGDCFCYADEDDYEVLTIDQMIERLESSTGEYILRELDDMGDGDNMWKQFQDWCKRRLNYELRDRNT